MSQAEKMARSICVFFGVDPDDCEGGSANIDIPSGNPAWRAFVGAAEYANEFADYSVVDAIPSRKARIAAMSEKSSEGVISNGVTSRATNCRVIEPNTQFPEGATVYSVEEDDMSAGVERNAERGLPGQGEIVGAGSRARVPKQVEETAEDREWMQAAFSDLRRQRDKDGGSKG